MLSWAVLFAAVLATAPMKLDIRINMASSVNIQCEISIYAIKMRFGGILNRRLFFGKKDAPFSLAQAIVFVKSIYTRAISRRLEISCHVGLGDAFATAVSIGGMQMLLRFINRSNVKIIIKPDFQNMIFIASSRCILLIRGGDIIIAGIRALGDRLPIILKGLNGNGKAKHRELDEHDDGKH